MDSRRENFSKKRYPITKNFHKIFRRFAKNYNYFFLFLTLFINKYSYKYMFTVLLVNLLKYFLYTTTKIKIFNVYILKNLVQYLCRYVSLTFSTGYYYICFTKFEYNNKQIYSYTITYMIVVIYKCCLVTAFNYWLYSVTNYCASHPHLN